MSQRVNVVIVRVQSTDLDVPDDFVLTPEGLHDLPEAVALLNRRKDEDTISTSIHIQVLEDEEGGPDV